MGVRRIEAVIFDFDGVLVDSEPLHEWAIRESVRPRGWDFSREKFYSEIVGRGDENAYRKIAEWNGTRVEESELRRMLEVKWGLMSLGIDAGKFTTQPGAAEVVRGIAERVPLGLYSGTIGATVRPMLEKIGLLEYFRAIVTGDLVKRMKPDPEGYLRVAEMLGVEPAACAVIEDTPTGARSARAAGMFVIAVGHTAPMEMLRDPALGVDMVIERIGGLEIPGLAQREME